MRTRRTAALACLLVVLAGCTATEVVPIVETELTNQAETTDADLAELQSRWWSWAASSHRRNDPINDPTGRLCAQNQPEDVWFLANSFGGNVDRQCVVPAGRPVVGPVITMYTTSRDDCELFMRDVQGHVTLDGRPVELLRADSAGILVTGAPENAVNGTEGTVRATSCGLWFRLPGLPVGEHTLVIDSRVFGTMAMVIYRLTATAAT